MITGKQVAAARNRQRLSQKELGEIIGRSPRTVSDWENSSEPLSDAIEARLRSVLDFEGRLAEQTSLADATDAQLLLELSNRLAMGRVESDPALRAVKIPTGHLARLDQMDARVAERQAAATQRQIPAEDS